MTIRKTAYETTACTGFILDKLQLSLSAALATGEGIVPINAVVDDKKYVNALYLVCGGNTPQPIPAFMHPILVKNPNANRDGSDFFIFSDVRSSVKYDRDQWKNIVKNQYEFDYTILYGLLNSNWNDGNHKLLLSISTLPISLYARWISENVTRRYGLTPQDQLIISTIAAYFYIGLFTNDETFEERELQRTVGLIAKSVYVNGEFVLNLIGDLPVIKNVEDFCNIIKEKTANIRLAELNKGVLFSILGSSWYGTNARELVAVSLEFPPAWNLIAYSSYVDRTFRNSGIAKLAIRDKKPEIDLYVKSLTSLLIHK